MKWLRRCDRGSSATIVFVHEPNTRHSEGCREVSNLSGLGQDNCNADEVMTIASCEYNRPIVYSSFNTRRASCHIRVRVIQHDKISPSTQMFTLHHLP